MKQESGFTMIEVLLAVALIAVLAAIGVPKINTLVATHEANTARYLLLEQLRDAKAEAIGRNTSIDWTLSNSNSGTTTQVSTGTTITPTRMISPNDAKITYQISGFTTPTSAVRFSSRGTIINAGTTPQITIQARGVTVTMQFHATTGWFN